MASSRSRKMLAIYFAALFVLPMCTRKVPPVEVVGGIRTDIANEIKTRFGEDSKAEIAAIAQAKVLQAVLDETIDPPTFAEKISKTNACLTYAMGPEKGYKFSGFLEKETFNTKERWEKYAKFNATLSGGAYKGYDPSPSLCEHP